MIIDLDALKKDLVDSIGTGATVNGFNPAAMSDLSKAADNNTSAEEIANMAIKYGINPYDYEINNNTHGR